MNSPTYLSQLTKSYKGDGSNLIFKANQTTQDRGKVTNNGRQSSNKG